MEFLLENHLGGLYITTGNISEIESECSTCGDSDKVVAYWAKDNKEEKIQNISKYFCNFQITDKNKLTAALFDYGLSLYGLEDTIEEIEFDIENMKDRNCDTIDNLVQENCISYEEGERIKESIYLWEKEQLKYLHEFDFSSTPFLTEEDFLKNGGSIKKVREKYQEYQDELTLLLEKMSKYQEELTRDDDDISLKEQQLIYDLINEKIRKNSFKKYDGIDLKKLKLKVLTHFPELLDYFQVSNKINEIQARMSSLLKDEIVFDKRSDDNHRHVLIRTDSAISCVECGDLTNEYCFSKEDIDFLEKAALEQGLLVESATKDDLALLKVLVEETKKKKAKRKKLDALTMPNDEYYRLNKYYTEEDEIEIALFNKKVEDAHNFDKGIYKRGNSKIRKANYFDSSEKNDLLEEINKLKKQINDYNPKWQALFSELLQTAYYEVLILSGDNIPSLVDTVKDDDDLIALTKAVNNLSNIKFRLNSDYFLDGKGSVDAYFYDYLTASKKINEKNLALQLKRK